MMSSFPSNLRTISQELLDSISHLIQVVNKSDRNYERYSVTVLRHALSGIELIHLVQYFEMRGISVRLMGQFNSRPIIGLDW